jgi:23S rRNA U2552 (ribose-2'-O)-methylase RlmE/FtsJ
MVIASDILEMDPLPGVTFLQGDFPEQEVFDRRFWTCLTAVRSTL